MPRQLRVEVGELALRRHVAHEGAVRPEQRIAGPPQVEDDDRAVAAQGHQPGRDELARPVAFLADLPEKAAVPIVDHHPLGLPVQHVQVLRAVERHVPDLAEHLVRRAVRLADGEHLRRRARQPAVLFRQAHDLALRPRRARIQREQHRDQQRPRAPPCREHHRPYPRDQMVWSRGAEGAPPYGPV
jgi:hypothetical protein